MDDLLLALVVLTVFTMMWITAALAGVIVIRQKLGQRNRVLPTHPSPAPTFWLWSPLPPARLHRRLQAVGATAVAAADHGPATAYDPDPVSLDDVAAQLAYQLLTLDAAVVRAARLPGSERRSELRSLHRQVRQAEGVAGRISEHRRPSGLPSTGWAAASPSPEAALSHLHDRLDRLDHARTELDAIELTALLPEQVLPLQHPELAPQYAHLPPPPAR